MKLFSITKTLSALTLCAGIGIASQPVVADHGIMQQAGNSCFPRVFSQIDQFKMSSGGLRNTNANPRTVVCSLNLELPDGGASPRTSLDTYLGYETLAEEMECTIYTRAHGTGMLLDSLTVTRPAGSTGINDFLGTTDWLASTLPHWEVNHYLQCKMPTNGRLFTTRTYYN